MDTRIWPKAASVFLLAALAALDLPAQTFNTLVNFDGTNGSEPQYVTLIQGRDGYLYGTAFFGGDDRCFLTDIGRITCGLVFKMTPSGALTIVHKFEATDGGFPGAGLVEAADGYFYGTTESGGTYGWSNSFGTIFRMTAHGDVTTLHTFDGADGYSPIESLVQGIDGDLYGTTGVGMGNGTVFKITRAGVFSTLYNFCSQPNCADGLQPGSPLIQGSDGSFYGTTVIGGAGCTSGCGTIFRITPQGTLTTLYSFNGTDGAFPSGSLVEENGNLYGTTSVGGTSGTVFQFNLSSGTLTTLHDFNFAVDGSTPLGGLVRGSDGNLYGTTYQGGPDLEGTVFQITSGGVLTILHNFSGMEGAHCDGALLQGTDGSFYGVTYEGGTYGLGTIFSISVGLGPFVKTEPHFGKVGAEITILGTSLNGTSDVTFNGVPATFSVNASGSSIAATVPYGATTGKVEVSTPGGTLVSTGDFLVR